MSNESRNEKIGLIAIGAIITLIVSALGGSVWNLWITPVIDPPSIFLSNPTILFDFTCNSSVILGGHAYAVFDLVNSGGTASWARVTYWWYAHNSTHSTVYGSHRVGGLADSWYYWDFFVLPHQTLSEREPVYATGYCDYFPFWIANATQIPRPQ